MERPVPSKPSRSRSATPSMESAAPSYGPQHELSQNIAFQMACVISRMEQALRDSVLRQLDLSYSHYRLLQVLFDRDGQQIGDLARALVVRQPVLSRVIDQMEERRLVRRAQDSGDSRVTRVLLTPHGRKQFLAARPGAQEIVTHALRVLDAEERALLADLLHRMNRHLP